MRGAEKLAASLALSMRLLEDRLAAIQEHNVTAEAGGRYLWGPHTLASRRGGLIIVDASGGMTEQARSAETLVFFGNPEPGTLTRNACPPRRCASWPPT